MDFDIVDYLDKNKHLDSRNFDIGSKIYLMTTENIKEFIDNIYCTNRKVLTVTGSGDQALNTILKGARDITYFDVNPLTFYHAKLKNAAVRTLSFEDYLLFFYLVNNTSCPFTFFDMKLFDKVCNNLDDNTISFFTTLIDYFKDNKKLKESIYYSFDYNINQLCLMNNYMNKYSYNELSDILNHNEVDFRYIESNITELTDKIGNKKYDIILLSNISDYLNKIYFTDQLREFSNDVVRLIFHLDDLGIIQVGYIYYGPKHQTMASDFLNKKKRREIFMPEMYHTIRVTAYDDPYSENTDQVIYYQKYK